MRFIQSFFLPTLFLTTHFAAPANAQSLPSRPPQYIMLAFDGSKSLSMWDSTIGFAAEASQKLKQPVEFTYFISGVYFLSPSTKSLYKAPNYKAGQSGIGWGEGAEDIVARVKKMNSAIAAGHEIASHANGHFDGSSWSYPDWKSEFEQFENLVFNFIPNNSLNIDALGGEVLRVLPRDVVGFRAPLLGVSQGLWPTLKDKAFRYDTSRVSTMNYWPQRDSFGVWNFPLASVRIVGSGKKTLSMDYNFFVAQSNGSTGNPSDFPKFEQEMFDTYMSYFKTNYEGNRAPVHIGHHFSTWNGAAYWKAMKRFALAVCGLPEVKCVTYKDLADYMDTLDADTLQAYQKGQFQRVVQLPMASLSTEARKGVTLLNRLPMQAVPAKAHVFSIEELDKMGLQVDPAQAHEDHAH